MKFLRLVAAAFGLVGKLASLCTKPAKICGRSPPFLQTQVFKKTKKGTASGAFLISIIKYLAGFLFAGKRIVFALYRAFKMRTTFNGDGFVDDITFNPRRSGEAYF